MDAIWTYLLLFVLGVYLLNWILKQFIKPKGTRIPSPVTVVEAPQPEQVPGWQVGIGMIVGIVLVMGFSIFSAIWQAGGILLVLFVLVLPFVVIGNLLTPVTTVVLVRIFRIR